MKRLGWIVAWALLPATAVWAFTVTPPVLEPAHPGAWVVLTLLASCVAAGLAGRRRRPGARTGS